VTVPEVVQRNGSTCSFACVPDKEHQAVIVLAGKLGLPITVDLSKCATWHEGMAAVRRAIAEDYDIPPDSFGFHWASNEAL